MTLARAWWGLAVVGLSVAVASAAPALSVSEARCVHRGGVPVAVVGFVAAADAGVAEYWVTRDAGWIQGAWYGLPLPERVAWRQSSPLPAVPTSLGVRVVDGAGAIAEHVAPVTDCPASLPSACARTVQRTAALLTDRVLRCAGRGAPCVAAAEAQAVRALAGRCTGGCVDPGAVLAAARALAADVLAQTAGLEARCAAAAQRGVGRASRRLAQCLERDATRLGYDTSRCLIERASDVDAAVWTRCPPGTLPGLGAAVTAAWVTAAHAVWCE